MFMFTDGVHSRNINVSLNTYFARPDIDQWVQRYMEPMDIEASALVRTTKETPIFPSTLVAIRDNRIRRILKYIKVDPHKLRTDDSDVSQGLKGSRKCTFRCSVWYPN